MFRGREHPENPGAYLTSDCRGNLRRIHEEFQQEHGLNLRAGTEPEMMWLKKDENGKPAGGYSEPYCYHIDQFESLRPVYMKVIEYATQMGLEIIQSDHEDAPGQIEINFSYDEVLRNADRLTTFRQICAQVAREFDLIACFMSKPFMEVSASGCHTNISLWRGGETEINKLNNDTLPGLEESFTYAKGGENVFLPEGDSPRVPGTIGQHALGGLLEHLPGITIFGCQTVNSYKRLLEPGYWAPVYANWGYQNRTAGIRNSAPGRFEYKAVDSSHNPYMMGAALLKAMDDGIKRELSPGEPEQRNIYDLTEEDRSQYTKLPMSLGEGLEAMEADEVAKSALPGEMYRVFTHYKRDEWERYLATVTAWDLDTYLDCLP
jgi:glutamine synthetase